MKHTLLKKAFVALVLIAGIGVGAWAAITQVNADGDVATVDGKGYATLQAALNAANGASGTPTVKLLKDVENVATQLQIRHSMILDLNGKTISEDENATFSPLVSVYTSNGEVTIQGEGTIEVNRANPEGGFSVIAISQGTLNLNGGNIKAETSATTGQPVALSIEGPNSGLVVNLNGADLTAKGGESTLAVNNRWAGKNDVKFPEFNINSGSVTAENENGTAQGVVGNGTVNMKGGTITVRGKGSPYGIYFPLGNINQKIHHISGGTIKVTNLGTSSTYDVLYGPAVITGGKFFLESAEGTNAHAVFSNGNNDRHYAITVSGGFFNRPIADAYISNEARQVALTSGTEYAEGYRYAIERSKFHVDVTGYNPTKEEDGYRAPVSVAANVFKDYSFVVTLPAAGEDALGADTADVNLSMTGVRTLDFASNEIRRYSKGFNTGLAGASANLSNWLPNTYKFDGATCPVTIKADGQEKNFTYNIAGINPDNRIVGTPSSESDARAAWNLLTSKVETQKGITPGDTHMLFKAGAYLQIGDEKLVFLKDFDFLKGSATQENLFSDAQVRIEKANLTGAKTVKASVYLPAGSTLGVSNSAADITEDVTVTMDGTEKAGTATVTSFFTNLKANLSQAGDNATAMKALAIKTLLEYFDGIIGAVDQMDGVSFAVEFTPAKPVKFHVDVTGYDAGTNDPIAVNADVFNDYSFKVALPDPLNDNLSASKATVNIAMTGVQTLGLKEGETRSYTKTVNTGVDNVSAQLSGALKNTYAFKGATCPVTIKADGQEKKFSYDIKAINDNYEIVGVPSQSTDAQEAWHLLTSKVSASQDLTTNDTHFLFKKGAYLQVGDEKLVFLKDFDFLKGTASIADLFSDAAGNVQIQHASPAATTLKVYLPVGSTLGVSSSAAYITENMTLTANIKGQSDINGAFSSYKKDLKDLTTSENGSKAAIALLIVTFDHVIGDVSEKGGAEFTVEFTQPTADKNVKFHVDVTGYDADNDFFAIPVNADVFNDYSFKVALPDPSHDNLTASKATVNIAMTGVQTLGLKEGETRSYSKTVETGVDGVSARLSGYLKNTYAFNGASCPVTIKDATGSKQFTYNIAGINGNYEIVGTPSKSADAQAAWHLLTSHVKASQDTSVDDTHFLFKAGSYLQIGDERLVFLKDFDFLKGAASMETLFDGAQVRIEKANVSGAKSVKAAVYLPAGSTLGVSSSNATVDQDVKVTMDGSDKAADDNALTGFFTKMKGDQQLNAKAAIGALVYYFDQIIGAVDQMDGVSFAVEFTQPKPVKFHVDVTGYSKDGTPAAVNADVFNDYSFTVALPDPANDALNASKATVNISMTGVQTLGLKEGETRSYSKTLETGVEGVDVQLHGFLKNTYAFNGVKAPVTIKDETGSKEFTYNIDGINEDYQIVGTPSSTEDARAAWHLMTSHVKASQDLSTDDTHFLFKKGAYLQLGDEKLVFDADYDFLKGSANIDELFSGIKPYVRVVKSNLTGDALKSASVYLPAGSTLGVSSSAASIDEDVKVTMDGSKSQANEDNFKGLLSGLRDKIYQDGKGNAKTAIALLVYYFDEVVGAVDGAEEVPFTVEFTKPETPKFHVDVTGYSSDDANASEVPVDADVYGDYHFVVSLPAPELSNLVASKATVNIAMTGVQTLGLKEGETRSYSKTVNTGVSGVNANLAQFLEKTYAFNGATCPVTVKDENGSDKFSYQIAGINDEYQIVGNPVTEDGTNGTEAARAAWHRLTSHVKASQDLSTDDTHFLFKKGAFLQIGDERLVFLSDFDFLKGAASMETLFNGANARIEKVNKTADAKAVVYLPEGSTLGVSSSAAAIDEDVYVTMDGTENGIPAQESFFSSMASDKEINAKVAIAALVRYFDAVVGAVDEVNGVSFTVEFKKNTAKTTKFHVDVTGYDYDDPTKEIPVNADVYSDYSFQVALPDPLNDNLTASKATLNVSMTGVQSLGLAAGETRSYTKTVNTGVDNVSAQLSAFLENTYKFNGVTAPVTIKDGDEEHSFTYNIAAIDSAYHIIGTPSSEADARTAWQFMVNKSHLDTQSGVTPEDSHFLFKKGSYIQIGSQKLVFTSDFDFLKGGVKQDATLADLFASAEIEQQEAAEGADDLAEVYLPAGSTLGLSSSAATVKKNVTISMKGANLAGEQVNNFFSNIQNAKNLDAKTAIGLLVKAFDEVIGAADNAEKVSFTVEFDNEGAVYYKNTANDEWTLMYSDANQAYNINGDNLYAFKVTADQENVNVNFTRKFTEGVWAAWVAPFDMEVTDELLQNYEFGYLEGVSNNGKDIDKNSVSGLYIGVKLLKAGQTIKANLPYVVLPKVTETKTFSLENVTLKKTEPQMTSITGHAYKYNLNGIFETKTPTDDIWFAVNKDGNFQKASSRATLKPFRFFLTITDNDNNPYAAKPTLIKLQIIDTPTGINGIENNANGEQKIYDLQGRRVYNPTVKGVYIVNGRKVILGK